MAGIYDAVQNDSLGQGVHQPVVQLIIDNLSRLQVNNIVQVVGMPVSTAIMCKARLGQRRTLSGKGCRWM